MEDNMKLNITSSGSVRKKKKYSFLGMQRRQRMKQRRKLKEKVEPSNGTNSTKTSEKQHALPSSQKVPIKATSKVKNSDLQEKSGAFTEEHESPAPQKKTPQKTTPQPQTEVDVNAKEDDSRKFDSPGLQKKREFLKRKSTGENKDSTSVKKSRIDDTSGSSKSSGSTPSLFRNNPDIPEVKIEHVDEVNEALFSTRDFSELNLHPHMVSNLEKNGFKQATVVQSAAIPCILSDNDVLIKSQTGSGKTLAYAVPLLNKLQEIKPKISRHDGPFVLVILPTRELAIQTANIFQMLVYSFSWIVPGTLMGGEKKKAEKTRIRKGINILISTPGRLLDHIENSKNLGLQNLSYLVIDEADRLLDMGFERDVSQIITRLDEKTAKRQTTLLSATLTAGVERLAGMSLKNPKRIDVSKITTGGSKVMVNETDVVGTFAMPNSLKNYYIVVPSKVRLVTLAAFLLWKCKYSNKKAKAVVFMATQDSVEFHHALFQNQLAEADDAKDKLQIYKLHGNMPQEERSESFAKFSSSESGVLLCTDVAARGLDFPYVRWIIQYNTPGTPKDYIHRVGRSARIGTQGRSLLFLAPSEVDYVNILNGYKINLDVIKMEDVLQTLLLEKKELLLKLPKGQLPQSAQECSTALQISMEDYAQKNPKVKSVAFKAYQSFIKSYATYPKELKGIFHIKHLHLGHVAKSFCIPEAPSEIAGVQQKQKSWGKGGNRKRDDRPKKKSFKNYSSVSEFAAG